MIGPDGAPQILLTCEHTSKWCETRTEQGVLLVDVIDYCTRAHETTTPDFDECGLYDPLTVALGLKEFMARIGSLAGIR